MLVGGSISYALNIEFAFNIFAILIIASLYGNLFSFIGAATDIISIILQVLLATWLKRKQVNVKGLIIASTSTFLSIVQLLIFLPVYMSGGP